MSSNHDDRSNKFFRNVKKLRLHNTNFLLLSVSVCYEQLYYHNVFNDTASLIECTTHTNNNVTNIYGQGQLK
jgi:hypothetical protein